MNRSPPIDLITAWLFLALLLALSVTGIIQGEFFDRTLLVKLTSEMGELELATILLLIPAFMGVGWQLSRHNRIPSIAVFLGIIALLAVFFSGPLAVLGVTLFWVSSYAIGALVLQPEKQPEGTTRTLTILLSAALGCAFHVAWMSLLAGIPMHTSWSHFALLSLPLLLFPQRSLHRLRLVLQPLGAQPALAGKAEKLAYWLIMALLGIYFIAAVNPEIGADALAMHLVVSNEIVQQHHWPFDFHTYIWALMPMGGDWIYAIVSLFGGEPAAQLSNYSLLLITTALLWAFLAALLPRVPAILGVLVYVSTPMLLLATGSLFIENAWTLFCLAGITAVICGIIRQETTCLLTGAALIGAACATKFMAVFLIPPIMALVALGAHRQQASVIRMLLIASALILIFGAAPYLRAWLMTGNPVFPFMNDIFQSPAYAATAFDNPLYRQPTTWRTLYDITFFSGQFLESRNGALGLHYFVLLPLALILGRRMAWPGWYLLGTALLFVLAVFQFQTYLRYIVPALPLAAAAIAWMLAGAQSAHTRLSQAIIIALIMLTPVNIALLTKATWSESWPLMASLLWPDARRQALADRTIPERHVVRYLNDSAAGEQRVLWLADPYIAGAKPHILLTNWYNPHVNKQVYQLRTSSNAAGWLAELAVDWVVLEASTVFDLAPLENHLQRHATLRHEFGGIRVYSLNHAEPAATRASGTYRPGTDAPAGTGSRES